MSAPLFWIILPGIIALGLLPFRHWRAGIPLLAGGAAVILAIAAWMIPFGEALSMGPGSVKVAEALAILGRNFILRDADRPLLTLFYMAAGLWILGAYLAKPNDLFAPLALGMTSLWTAALAVEPFLYAAMLIEVTVLLSIPLLVPLGKRPGRGVYRYLSFQTLGMPFILFTGWMLEGVEASPSNLTLVVRAAIMMALGFAFLLAIFPFHSWVPMLAEEAHPYVAGFLLVMLPGVLTLFGLGFLDRYAWLRDSSVVFEILRITGLLMVLLGGVWAAFQENLGRIFGYAIMSEVGYSLLAIGLNNETGMDLFFAMGVTRGLTALIWIIALGRIYQRTEGDLDLASLRGFAEDYPFLTASLLLAHLSMTGMPLLALFPVRAALWTALAGANPGLVIYSLAGTIGLLAAGLRTLIVMVANKEGEPRSDMIQVDEIAENSQPFGETIDAVDLFILGLSATLLLLTGLVPQWYLGLLSRLPLMFGQLIP